MANEEKKVSVVIPIYNAEKYLGACVDSLLNQTYSNLEIILVDDESSDGSPEICDSYTQKSDKVRVIHKKNGGASAARNTGMKEATGEYLHFCDADDWIEPRAYQNLVEQMEKTNADVAFFGWYVDIPEAGGVRCVSQADNAPCGEANQDDIFKEMLIVCGSMGGKIGYGNYIWNKIYRRSKLYDKDGELILFDESVKIAEDGLWLMEVGQNWKKGFFDNTSYYHYLRNSASVMNTAKNYAQTRLASQESHIRMLEILREFNPDYFEIHRKTCNEFFWSTAKSAQGAASFSFVGKVISNILLINDGVCPDNIARDIQWYIRNNEKNRTIMARKPVKAAVKFTDKLDGFRRKVKK